MEDPGFLWIQDRLSHGILGCQVASNVFDPTMCAAITDCQIF